MPEITKDMVIASIVKQVKSNMQRSRLMLEQKERKKKKKIEQLKNKLII